MCSGGSGLFGDGLGVVGESLWIFTGCAEEEVEFGVFVSFRVLFLVIGVQGRAVRESAYLLCLWWLQRSWWNFLRDPDGRSYLCGGGGGAGNVRGLGLGLGFRVSVGVYGQVCCLEYVP